MELYKFRPLGTCKDLERIIDIIENGVYCNDFFGFNDMNEGIYINNSQNTNITLDEKLSYLICSFSGVNAVSNELMWGHYANAGKGVLIKFNIDDESLSKIKKIKYSEDKEKLDSLEEVLTHKLKDWEYENEYRFLTTEQIPSKKVKVGEIDEIFFGTPYEDLVNYEVIKKRHVNLGKYHALKEELIRECKQRKIKSTDFRFQF